MEKGLEDGVVSQVYSLGRCIVTEESANGDITVKAGTEADVKSYLDYGADCSRVVFAKYLWASRLLNFIND